MGTAVSRSNLFDYKFKRMINFGNAYILYVTDKIM